VNGLDCRGLVELLTAYLDGQLDPPTARRLAEHLARCGGCERYLDQVRVTVRALRDLPTEPLPPRRREMLLAAFRLLA